jgi:hypothetical protein
MRISQLRYAQALTRKGRPRHHTIVRHELAAAQDAAATGIAVPVPDEPEPAEPVGQAATCTREGRQWRIRYGTRSVRVGHRIGLLHLAVLLANPGAEISSIELATGAAAFAQAAPGTSLSSQPMLDRAAIQQYRDRLSQLRAEIDRLESTDQRERVARACAERDWLMAELTATTGLGGRTRRFPDSVERARIAVGKAIRRAIARIHTVDPFIGEHLQRSVHTGVRCSYQPV